MRVRSCVVLAVLSLVGCAHAASQDACSVPGLEHAHTVAEWTPPSGCSLASVGSPAAPRVVHDASELADVLTCTGAMPTLDLRRRDLYVYAFSMSPAYGGGAVLDDGTVVTIVQHDRSPCPSDPRPMPMTTTRAFFLPKGATRAFQRASCTLPRHCP